MTTIAAKELLQHLASRRAGERVHVSELETHFSVDTAAVITAVHACGLGLSKENNFV
jgi:hypothetical protein